MSDYDGIPEQDNWLRQLAQGLVGDDHVADDVAQDAMITAWRRPPRDRQASPAWLARVVRNLVRMHFRSSARRRRREEWAACSEVQEDTATLEVIELRREIVRGLQTVDEPFRKTLILRYYHDLNATEIARLHGVPAATVRGRLKRGLDRLRTYLENRHDNVAPAICLLAGIEYPPTAEGTTTSAARSTRRAWIAAAAVIELCVTLLLVAGFVFDASGSHDEPRDTASTLASMPVGALDSGAAATRAPTAKQSTDGAPAWDVPTLDASPRTSTAVAVVLDATGANNSIDARDSMSVLLEVVDDSGEPIAGARVANGQRRLATSQIAAGYASTLDFIIAETSTHLLGRTGSDGRLRIAIADVQDAALAISAAGHLTHREAPTHRNLADGRYRVRLEPQLETEITVASATGEFLSGCTVSVINRSGRSEYSTQTNHTITHASADDVELVSFVASGYAAVQDLLASPRHHQRLLQGRPTMGRVVDADGRGVADARVSMRSTLWRGPAYDVTTDALGRFETFNLAASGTLELEIRHPDHPTLQWQRTLPCDDLGELKLEPAKRIQGRVVDRDGRPCANATVSALPKGKFLSRQVVSTQTDNDGYFELWPLRRVDYDLRVEHDDFAFAEQTVDSAVERATISLDAGAGVSGIVRTRDGQPIAGVPIRIGTIVGDELRGPIVCTQDDGRFLIDHLPRGLVRHRARRKLLRWRALDATELDAPTPLLIAELFLPYQLSRANGVSVPTSANYGSRNSVAVRVGDELRLEIATPEAQPPVDFELVGNDGNRIRAVSNVLIVSPQGWIMKDFAGVDGQPYHLPNPWVLDGAQLTVMSYGHCWQTVRADLRGQDGRVRFRLTPKFERPPVLCTQVEEPTQFLAAPLLTGIEPLAALPLAASDDEGRLRVATLGPGRYALCIARDPSQLIGSAGKPRLAIPMSELYTVGEFTLSSEEGQIVAVRLDRPDSSKEVR